MGNHIEVDFCAGVDLSPVVVQRHQQIGGKHVGLVLNLSVFRVPAHHILIATLEAVRIGRSMHEVVTKLVGEGVVNSPLRRDATIEEYAPTFLSGRSAEQGTVEPGQRLPANERDRFVAISPGRIFPRHFWYIDGKAVRSQYSVKQET